MPKQLVVGKIEELYKERDNAWNAFYQSDEECERLREEIKRLKLRIAQLEKRRRNG